jgi:hypothetical protein
MKRVANGTTIAYKSNRVSKGSKTLRIEKGVMAERVQVYIVQESSDIVNSNH